MRHRVRAQGGFTLVELLVTITAGVVIMLATFDVLDLSVRQGASATDRVEATQNGRMAMERLMQELHSSCVWVGANPVLPGSDGTTLYFVSGVFTSSATPVPTLHKVWLSSTGGPLYDSSYAINDSTTPPSNWDISAFSTTASSTRTLAGNVSPQSGTSSIFTYYQYVNGSIDLDAAHQLSAPLDTTSAGNAAEVAVSLAVGPSDTSSQADRTININDAALVQVASGSNSFCQ